LPGVDSILEYGASLFWRKMMKRRKHGSEPVQFTRDFHRINGAWIESDVILRSYCGFLKRPEVGVFVCEQNAKDLCIGLQLSRKA
jgi:hypothetical protein